MTRYELIKKKANELCNDPANDYKSTEDLCIMMAGWADENPDINPDEEVLSKINSKFSTLLQRTPNVHYEEGYKQGWKDAIEKCCLYMENCKGYVVSGNKCNYDNFIKFMEEQQ